MLFILIVDFFNIYIFVVGSGSQQLYVRMVPMVMLDGKAKAALSSFDNSTGDIVIEVSYFTSSVGMFEKEKIEARKDGKERASLAALD